MSGPTHQKQMAERRAIIRSEQQSAPRPNQPTEPSTMHAMSRLSNDLEGRQSARDYLSGQDEGVFYPRLPANSPWSGTGPQLPPEEFLGYSVNDLTPCGEVFEQQASLSATARISAEADNGAECAPTLAALPPAEVVETSAPTSSITRASTTPVGDGDGANHSTVRNPVPNLIHRPARKL
jgi:hypothetical protein